MENGAIAKRMWLHGDVAHHNFLRVGKQRVVLIDFRPCFNWSKRIRSTAIVAADTLL